MSTTESVSPAASAKRMSWGLLIAALLTPACLGGLGVISSFRVGELTFQVGFGWVCVAIFIDLLTKKRDAISKANGRIVASVLALLMALTAGYNAYRDIQKIVTAKREMIEQFMASTIEAKTATSTHPVDSAAQIQQEQSSVPSAHMSNAEMSVNYLNTMKRVGKKFAEDAGAIDKKFDAINLTTVLLPQNLVTKAGLAASRVPLNDYKSVIGERDAMISAYLIDTEKALQAAGFSERQFQLELAGLYTNKDSVKVTYANLSRIQLASVKATEDIINFAESLLGRIVVEKGQPIFESKNDWNKYQLLAEALKSAAVTETALVKEMTEKQLKNKQALVDQLK